MRCMKRREHEMCPRMRDKHKTSIGDNAQGVQISQSGWAGKKKTTPHTKRKGVVKKKAREWGG